jgi:signal transduction histidine kinase/CheY-like chemotaxis protein
MSTSYSEESESLNIIHDIKETLKRTRQVILITLLILIINGTFKAINGLYLSVVLQCILFIVFCFLLLLNKRGMVKATNAGIVISISISLVLFCFAEGTTALAHMYFIPLAFGIPIIAPSNKLNNKETISYLLLTFISFCLCILFVKETSNWQYISDKTLDQLTAINSLCTIFLSCTFAYLNIYFERRYLTALIKEKWRAEKAIETRAKFLSNMGHELRTPLNGIIGATSILKKESILSSNNEYLNIIKYCSNHMLELVNELLDFHKIEAGKFELNLTEFNLKNSLEQFILSFANRFEEKKIALKVDIDPNLDFYISADDTRLIQILNNVISNAWKFTEQGSVKFRANLVEQKQDSVRVFFSIEDSGIGIEKENLEKIFESFWQVHSQTTRIYSGTGLGLAICQRLLKMMESNLEVESEPGKGTIFYFALEFKTVENKQQKMSAQNSTAKLPGRRILIAEDNKINMMIAKKLFQDWEIDFTECYNGSEALEALKCDQRYDVILLDLEMPVMDGYAAMKKITVLYPNIPVLAFTAALIDNNMFENLLNIGFSDCILKPFQPTELFNKIREQMQNSEYSENE